jgi:large subunit ribosomal protein L4
VIVPTLPVYDTSGARAAELEVSEAVFGAVASEALLHQVSVAELAARRRGTAHTKTRGEVAGSNRKLWRQKGTGRARVGDQRPPSRVGGGVAAGPRARSYRQRISRGVKTEALRGALSARAKAGEIMLVEPFELAEAKTRALQDFLHALGVEGDALLVLGQPSEPIWRCGRNIVGLRITDARQVSAHQVLAARSIIITTDALPGLEARVQ